MTNSSGPEFGDTQAITHMLDSMRKGQLEATHDGTSLEIGRKLGEGGTKTVYEAVINSNPFALAFPNATDGVQIMTQKWKVALQEPANTDKIKAIGLFLNPICEVMKVNINGAPFPILKMARYQDLPFQIMDGKNPRSSTVDTEILPKQLDDATFEEYFSSILPDLQSLIQNGVRVGIDSVNICIVDGKPRIFLSDLGNAEFELIPRETMSKISEKYVMFASGAFLNGLTETEYQKHKVFFDGETFSVNNDNNITHRLSERLLRNINDAGVS
jgi:hypothetical protein